MASLLDIWNNALSEIASDTISSPDENSLQAQECNRVWPGLVQEYLTWADWEHQIIRAQLALEANSRAGEWTYQYAKPSDLAEVISIVPPYSTNVSSGTTAGPFASVPVNALGRIAYLLVDDSIYCNVQTASLDYVSTELQIGKVRALERRALELELAQRLAMPIKKSRELKGDLIKQAEVARERAVADQKNRSYSYSDYVSLNEYARAGYEDIGLSYGV